METSTMNTMNIKNYKIVKTKINGEPIQIKVPITTTTTKPKPFHGQTFFIHETRNPIVKDLTPDTPRCELCGWWKLLNLIDWSDAAMYGTCMLTMRLTSYKEYCERYRERVTKKGQIANLPIWYDEKI